MKQRLHFFAFLMVTVMLFATSCQKETVDGPLPKVHVLAGVGDGNLSQETLDLAAQAAKNGVMIVRSSRIPFGGVYTEGGEVDDEELGFIASGSLNPQKSRILLMLALTATQDINTIRSYFKNGVYR